jgi:nucleoid DNA-binding protein
MSAEIVETFEKKLAQLPAEKQKEVQDFIDSLVAQVQTKKEEKGEVNKSGFGALKGTIWMADDFDEPLEDFKDYM